MGKKKIQSARADVLKRGAKRKISKRLTRGKVYIKSSYNNTIITVTDEKGDVITWSSSGSLGFKGAKKATPYAATSIVNDLSERLQSTGLREIEIYIKGVGSGRDASVRALAGKGYDILMIKDVTPIPHNGCRPRKARRV